MPCSSLQKCLFEPATQGRQYAKAQALGLVGLWITIRLVELFITWSGPKSRAVAEALRKELPKVLNAFQPWLSSSDLGAGARWVEEVGRRLESAKAGIVCLTPANLNNPWILFETGALAKVVQKSYVCPIRIGLETNQVEFPLAQFQSEPLTRDGIWGIITTLRKALPADQAMTDKQVEEVFELVWPGLEKAFANLPSDNQPAPPPRPPEEMMIEILDLVRGLSGSKPAQTIDEWDTGIVGVASKIANELGLDLRSVFHSGVHRGVYSIDLQTTNGKMYPVRVPVGTSTSDFETVVRGELMKELGAVAQSAQSVRQEMVPDESDFLNSKT